MQLPCGHLTLEHTMAGLYNLSSYYWGDDVISLRALTVSGDVFATIPLLFLQSSGTNTWRYIDQFAAMLVSSVPSSHSRLLDQDGHAIGPTAVPYVYVFASERAAIYRALRNYSLIHSTGSEVIARICSWAISQKQKLHCHDRKCCSTVGLFSDAFEP